jgi:hypothetical protein
MKLNKLIAALLILMVYSLCLGEDIRRDGNWWLSQEKHFRTFYVIGFIDGMEFGSHFFALKNGTEAEQLCIAQAIESFREQRQKYFGNVTVGQLSDGLDSFYADYRNRRIVVFAAVWLVVNGIVGTPEEKLNKMIESSRQVFGN